MLIHEKIKARRIELGLTQDELAQKTGYTSRSSINKIEKGLIDLSQSKIIELAAALKMHPSELVDWEDYTLTNQGYYYDPEVAEMANEIKDNPHYRVLFEASRNLKKEDIDFIKSMIDRMKGNEHS